MATLTQALEQWTADLSVAEGLVTASRYQLEHCAEAFWQEIISNPEVSDTVFRARRLIKTELRRRDLA